MQIFKRIATTQLFVYINFHKKLYFLLSKCTHEMLLQNVQKEKKKAHFCSRVGDIGLELSEFLELLNNQGHAVLNAEVPTTIG